MTHIFLKIKYLLILLIIGGFVVLGYNHIHVTKHRSLVNSIPEFVQPIKKPKTLTLTVVGDIMAHRPLVQSGYNPQTRQYNFSQVFTPVGQYLVGDIVLGNLETPIAGDEKGFLGYPMFNAPLAYLQALRSSGFTHLNVANNHSLDQRFTGLQKTVKNISEYGMTPLGFRESPEQYQIESVTTDTGMRVGMFAGSYGFNGFQLPTDQQYTVMNYSEHELLETETEINNRKNEFDVLVAYLHIGDEYQRTANTLQKSIAQRLCDDGVRIIIMSHPHVLQPLEYLSGTTGQSCLVAYSMGNFISNQQQPYTDLGGILQVSVDEHDGNLQISPVFIPTAVRRERSDNKLKYQVLPLPTTEKPSWMSDEKWAGYVRETGKIVEKIK